MNQKWLVVNVGPDDGYGIASNTGSFETPVLQVMCKGMRFNDAVVMAIKLNQAPPGPMPARRRR